MRKIGFYLILIGLFLASCKSDEVEKKQEILIYCGITMVKPISQIAQIIEKQENCKVTIVQGGSEDLYESIVKSQTGDLYLPGSKLFYDNHLNEGILLKYQIVGFNQLALMVQKGNPKNIKADAMELLNPKLKTIIGNYETGSVGKETEKQLKKIGIYEKAFQNAVTIAADSRDMNKYLIKKEVDLILNWKATGFFEDTRNTIDVITLSDSLFPKKPILIAKIKYSKNPKLTQKFVDFTVSEKGKAIFKYYGFL
jgi:molybdate transport system substrate-binding protein